MATGKVKWFSNEKKYGFILIDGREVFVHFSAILKDGYKTLKKGQDVECDIEKNERGERAVNVKILPTRPPLPNVDFNGKKQPSFSHELFHQPKHMNRLS